ncbi:MAG: hypothetical protein U1F76_24925 [Candidatus Competibacteraceae bacterium]
MSQLIKLLWILIFAVIIISLYRHFLCNETNIGLCCKPGIKLFSSHDTMSAKKEVFLREIYILLDCTDSMVGNFDDAKKIIKNHISPSLSPGDTIAGYCIKDRFDTQNLIIEKSLPILEFFTNKDDAEYCTKCGDWQQLWRGVTEIQRQLEQQLNELKLPLPDQSDYFGALDNIATLIKPTDIKPANNLTKLLIVIGDLQQTPAPRPFSAPSATDDKKQSFRDTAVWVIYPSPPPLRDVVRKGSVQPILIDQWIKLWKTYFADRGNSNVQFWTFLQGQKLLKNALESPLCSNTTTKCSEAKQAVQN